MAEGTPSDGAIEAALRHAVGDPSSDLAQVLALGRQARRARTRRSMVIFGSAGLVVAVALLSFAVLRSEPTTPEPAHVPKPSHSSGISSGTYSTDPLSTAQLMRAGMKREEIGGQKTVFTLTFQRLLAGQTEGNQNGTYTQLQAEDGGPPQRGDTGAFAVRGRTITFVSSFHFERSSFIVHRTADGFRLSVKRFFCKCPSQRRVARVIWTIAAFHRS